MQTLWPGTPGTTWQKILPGWEHVLYPPIDGQLYPEFVSLTAQFKEGTEIVVDVEVPDEVE